MILRARPAWLAGALLSALAAGWAGCHGRSSGAAPGGDAGADVGGADALEPQALDFAVTGCARYDVGAARCFGAPPLSVSFSPVSSPALTRFLWDFGDGTAPSTERAPAHSYILPGTYDVTVTGAGDVGTVQVVKRQLIAVAVGGAGAPCDVDAQCGTGLSCLCGAGSDCPAAFVRGLCTAPCSAGACGAGAVCAQIALAGATSLCLAPCQADTDCAAGLACRDLPGGGAAGQPRWARACFPAAALVDVGQPCPTADGALDDGACLSGLCADLGALGLCSADCGGAGPCPTGSACATFGDGRTLCLAACATAGACARDPLLDCESPGGTGPLGFEVALAPAPGTTYCAPRRCTSDVECAPAGLCEADSVGGTSDGHCVRR